MRWDPRRTLLGTADFVRGRRVVPVTAIWICSLALAYTNWSNSPGTSEQAGMAAIAVLGVAGLTVRRRAPFLGAVLLASGGAVAVTLTTSDYASFWPAASTLLFLAATTPRGEHRHVGVAMVAAAGIVGCSRNTLDLGPAALSVVVAALAVAVARVVDTAVERARLLEVEAERLREKTFAAETENRELARRTDLARELHDTLGHHLSAMVVQAEAGQVAAPDTALASIGDLGREALAELEAVLFELRGPTSHDPRGTVDLARVDTRLAEPLRRQGVAVDVHLRTAAADPDLRWSIYRIVQESLTNVMRHAGATCVSVEVADDGDEVLVRVADDGVGLPRRLDRGVGLTGIVERARLHAGSATFEDASPHGTVVEARLRRIGA